MPERQDREREAVDLARVNAAISAAGDLIYEWDLADDRLRWVGTASNLFGANQPTPPGVGEDLQRLIHPEDLPRRTQAVAAHLTAGRDYECEYRIRGEDGQFHWVHDRGAAIAGFNGTPARLVGILRLVTQRKQREARLEYLANYDDLTGHFNKLRLREALDQALVHGLRFGQTGAFLVVGLDQMGRINTAYGHEAGDAVLFEIARRLETALRPTDMIGRLGSDRFGIVLVGCDEAQAQETAEHVLQMIRQSPIKIRQGQVHITCSASLVFFPNQSKTPFDLIAKGEGALLMAKAAGRDCLTVYEMSEEQRRDHRASLAIGEEVKEALKDDRLLFAFQPVVNSVTGKISFYESLLRMHSTDGELVVAGKFVQVVEELGLVRMVDRRALDLVMDELSRYPDVTLALNISGLTAADRSWLRNLVACLKDHPDLAQRLIVEITETAALYDIEESAAFVSTVRDLGCRVALDDFGAGFTTFRHLKALTVDIIKIDGSFVKDIRHNEGNQLFIRSLLNLARSFGLETVAECVETAEDAAYLRDEGIELLQGYYYGKPDIAPAWRGAPLVEQQAAG